MHGPRPTIRIDKWLWYARFLKTRGLASKLVAGGHVRVNSGRVSKPSHGIGQGDTLTFPQGRQIRVVRVAALGTRRGPAPEAQALYQDLTPPPEPQPAAPKREAGRPDRKHRRMAARLKGFGLE
ncbi:MAG: RNA-binding S4 domain-containing protein [Rhodobacteraceae bacterium]|nr:RNA-binding S4 domain-containing protein [Paracoccaceae bacterium]